MEVGKPAINTQTRPTNAWPDVGRLSSVHSRRV